MDEVDLILAAWARELPDLDVSPLASLSRVSRLARHLDRARTEIFAAHDLEVWEFDVLAALRRKGAPYLASPGDLIQETLSTSGTMTNRINRLAERGLVVREPHPSDGRGVQVRLTEPGRERLEAAFSDLLDFERRVLHAIGDDQHSELVEALREILAIFENR